MQGSARKDVVFGAARVYTFTVPGPKWKSWLDECRSIDYPQANDVTFKKAQRVRPNPSEKQKILPIMEGEPPEDRNEG